MQTYDMVMLIVLAAATIFGAIKGFAWQVASLASIVVSYVVAYTFRGQVASMINATPPWNVFIAMLLLYAGSSFAIWMVFRLISTSIDKIKLRDFDRQLGAGLGLIKGALLCLLITMFAMSLLGQTQQQRIANSKSGLYISKVLVSFEGVLPAEIKSVVGPYIDGVEQRLEQGRGGFPPMNNGNGGFDEMGRFVQEKLSDYSRDLSNGALQGGQGQGGNGFSGGFYGAGQGGQNQPQPWNNSIMPNTWPNNNQPNTQSNGFGQQQQPVPNNYPPPAPWNAANPNGLR